MTRQSKRAGRAARRRHDSAVKILGGGLVLTLVPLVMGSSPVGKALGMLMPLGWLMLVGGAFLMWMNSRQGQPAQDFPKIVGTVDAAPRQARAVAGPTPVTGRPSMETVLAAQQPDSSFSSAPTAPAAWGKAVFDAIEWRRFEAVVEALFQQAGFETKSQSHGADEGVDVWLYSRHKPGIPVSLVQCKHWQGKRVGVDKIRELRGVMASRDVKRGQFATTSTFTPEAEAFARENGINLLGVNGLLTLIAKRTPEQQQALLGVAQEGDYMRPTCVNCGVKMVDRKPRNGGKAFWGCPRYPKCKTTLPMRDA